MLHDLEEILETLAYRSNYFILKIIIKVYYFSLLHNLVFYSSKFFFEDIFNDAQIFRFTKCQTEHDVNVIRSKNILCNVLIHSFNKYYREPLLIRQKTAFIEFII